MGVRRDPGNGPQARGTGLGIPQRPVGSGLAPAKATHSLTAQRSPQPAASLRPRGRRSPTKPPALASTWAAFASAIFRGPRRTRKPERCSPPARPQLATKRGVGPVSNPSAGLTAHVLHKAKATQWGGLALPRALRTRKTRLRPQTSYSPKRPSPGHRTARACSGPAGLYLALCPTVYARETLTDAPPHFPYTSRTMYARANVGISEYPSAAC